MRNTTFSKTDTNICKGIAILFMVLHHTVCKAYNFFDLSWYAQNSTSMGNMVTLFFSTAGKVCVSILTLLSGYGVAKSYSKYENPRLKEDAKFVLLRYAKLYSIYLPVCVFVLFLNIADVYKLHDIGLIKTACLQFTISLTMIFGEVGGWYIKAICMFYLLFPVLYKLIKKYGIWVIAVCAVPPLLAFVFKVIERGDSFLCYLLPFTLGIYFEQKGMLDKIKENSKSINVWIPTGCLVATFILRLIFSRAADIFFALAIVLFEIRVLSNSKFVGKILEFLGRHSANIWLIHKPGYVMWIGRISIRYLIVLTGSTVVSQVIEKLKKITPYNKMFSAIYKRIQSI